MISRKAKIGFGIAAVGVTGLLVGVVSAASAKKSKGALPPIGDDDEDEDDDDDVPIGQPPSSVEVPAPVMDGDDLGDVLAPDGPIFSNLPPIARPEPPRQVDVPAPPIVLAPPAAPAPTFPTLPPTLPTLPGILPPISPPIGTPQPAPTPAPKRTPTPTPAPALNPATQAAAAMVLELLDAQKRTGWKRKYDSVREWQSLAGRPKVDGMFGPDDALTIAVSFGDIPVVRYWPAESGRNPKKALTDYRAALEMLAKSRGGTQADELRQSAQREKGQSFGPPVGTGGKGVIV